MQFFEALIGILDLEIGLWWNETVQEWRNEGRALEVCRRRVGILHVDGGRRAADLERLAQEMALDGAFGIAHEATHLKAVFVALHGFDDEVFVAVEDLAQKALRCLRPERIAVGAVSQRPSCHRR